MVYLNRKIYFKSDIINYYNIRMIRKIIKIGSSGGVTIPKKELERQKLNIGDNVEVIVRPIKKISTEDRTVLDAAKTTLDQYKQDFQNLAER